VSSIVHQKNGKYVYLYESNSYRDDKGKPQNNRKPVGKIDQHTGQPVYKPEYLERMAKKGTPIHIPDPAKSFTVEQIRHSSIKNIGLFYLLESLAKQIGLLNILESVFPNIWEEIFMLACYLVASGEPAMYCEDWIVDTDGFQVGSMSSQRISEMLVDISMNDRTEFYEKWGLYRSELEYLALDITSISSYSELIEDVEWGYNRDNENLPQINLCMLLGEKSGLPVYQTIYSGSLKDVSTLKSTLGQVSAIRQDKILIVMDKGFGSNQNINMMLTEPLGIRFIVAAPFSLAVAKKIVDSVSQDIDRISNTIVLGTDVFRGKTVRFNWQFENNTYSLFAHAYFNVLKAAKLKEDLYAHVTLLVQQAKLNPNHPTYLNEYRKYLKFGQSGSIDICQEVIEKELNHAGWLVLISNDVPVAESAINIYRTKDVVEKGFMRLKNCLDLGRLRVHSENSMQNKVFIGFIALILMAGIHRQMADSGLYKLMTMKKLIKIVEKLKVQTINGCRILYPLTKEQKMVYNAFNINEPVL